MPMGFYQPAQIVIDARKHGVQVRPVDVNHSYWDNLLEEKAGKYHATSAWFPAGKGLREERCGHSFCAGKAAYTSIHEMRDAGVSQAALEKLADADAFRSMGMDRRQALWEVSALADRPMGLFSGQHSQSEQEPEVTLPQMSASEHVVQDYASTSLSLKAHPVSFVQGKTRSQHAVATGIFRYTGTA